MLKPMTPRIPYIMEFKCLNVLTVFGGVDYFLSENLMFNCVSDVYLQL